MQRFVDHLVFLDDTISFEGNNQGYTPEGSGVPKVDIESRALADGALFTAE